MYIKTLTIQGFKSYRDQTQIEPFSPKHNVVVGRNGSGKSNFFAAIRFVLSDAYTSMSREERQSLLHEGVSTTTTLSAYVEIVFDNSDNRFPTGHDEVILRRTIGLKKDEYSLDKKSASKADVMNLLESAGFSKSNPYYIVPQGRITALTNAKDHERLALLKEVAGTKVYEQRRTESLRIMAETDTKRGKINELLDYIESRLTELEEEKEELRQFQDKDRERRCLEYALHQRELQDNELHTANERRDHLSQRDREIQAYEKSIEEHKHTLEALTAERDDVQAELTDFIGTRTEIKCSIDDMQSTSESEGGRRQMLQAELAQLESEITSKEAELDRILPEWEALRASEMQEKHRLADMQARLTALHSKRGRANRFRNKAERDAFLKQEISSLQSYKSSQSQALEATRAEIEDAKRTCTSIDEQLATVQTDIEEGRERIRDLQEQTAQLNQKANDLNEKRKEYWREDAKLNNNLARESEELKKAERTLAGMMDKDTGNGLRAVDQIKQRHSLEGVYGPLYRLFKIKDETFNIAVETTAGNSLFHVVVDTDETASRVLDIMIRDRIGRVTFMPLNRLHPNVPPMPDTLDAVPLINQLEFDETHIKALQQVFGKTCVCHTLEDATAYVKSHGINTITTDGDKVDRKGALTGGYHDPRRSRLDAVRAAASWQEKVRATMARSEEVKNAIATIDQEITRVSGQISRLAAQQAQIREARERGLADGTARSREKERLQARIEKLEHEAEELESELRSVESRLDSYTRELESPMTKGLTDAEEQELAQLNQDSEQSSKQLRELTSKRNTLESDKNRLEVELNESLRRRRDHVKRKLESLGDTTDDGTGATLTLAARQRELATLDQSIASLNTKLQALDAEIDRVTERMQKDRAALEKVQNQLLEDTRAMSKQQKTTERYLAKRQMLQNRKDECARNIRDLGVLPEEAFVRYVDENPNRLVRKLHAVSETLRGFAHVNKKAVEQYTNFTKQRDQLRDRRKELDTSAESIQELVDVLDQRKDEAIERTFKQVAKNFEEVFEGLVPAGRGRLIIQRKIDRDEAEGDEDEDGEGQGGIDNYTGVSIKVSFNSKVDEGLRIQQLSGGQKSLVALATVFAIQKCDPAPFYLFDEIDANLDAQYRTAVAAMIHSLSGTAQFITTTFRPEMLVTADKFYGVLFNNQKVSSIRAIKREEAMEFVDQEAQAQ
uniref:Structural maintenance of chromosomes protein n=1 Tax=Schizophyllum commune (strain H4-8 / FGSC 9210) TaxID=578458 RepID=D8PZC5_SCHCM